MAMMHPVKFRRIVIELDDDSVLEITTGDMTLETQSLYCGPPKRYEIGLRLFVDSVTYSHLAPEQARIENAEIPLLAAEGNKAIGAGEGNPRRLHRPSS